MGFAKISVKTNGGTFAKDLAAWSEGIQQAAADALTWTAYEAQKMMYAEFRSKFDRPTPYTMNSLAVRKATVRRPEAELVTKDPGGKNTPAGKFLDPEVYGGVRAQRSSERKLGSYYVPSKYMTLDSYGNIPASTVKKILTQLKADTEGNATNSKRSKRGRKNEAYFYREGIVYRRTAHSVPGAGGKDGNTFSAIIPQLILVENVPDYRRRIDWEGTAQKAFDEFFDEKFARALDRMGGA